MGIPELISKYLKYMEYIKSASPLTIRHYSLDLTQAFADEKATQLGTMSLEEKFLTLSRTAFQNWSKLSLASRNRKAATLKSFFNWAYQESYIQKDLSLQIHCPKVPKRIPHFISVDEAIATLQAFDVANPKDKLPRVLFLLLYGGGLRVSEACALRWKDVLFQQRSIRVRGKGGKERQILLPRLVIESLSSLQKELSSGDYVFGEQPLNPRAAYEMIRKSGKRAQLLKPLHPHALRHSYATHLITSGANIRTLQELLGHESLQATEKYTHLGVDHLARTLEGFHPLGQNQKKIKTG